MLPICVYEGLRALLLARFVPEFRHTWQELVHVERMVSHAQRATRGGVTHGCLTIDRCPRDARSVRHMHTLLPRSEPLLSFPDEDAAHGKAMVFARGVEVILRDAHSFQLRPNVQQLNPFPFESSFRRNGRQLQRLPLHQLLRHSEALPPLCACFASVRKAEGHIVFHEVRCGVCRCTSLRFFQRWVAHDSRLCYHGGAG
mmetsp:Transcript_50830/g.128207  ORF Transcript_50830/g.128207 Transcript_50830/m.128207 type:complete len:200 (+) Transcript_50830:563-1162(+)